MIQNRSGDSQYNVHAFDNLFSAPNIELSVSVLVKMGIAVLLGGLIGLEREWHGRPAGIRTHMLVILGVLLFTVVSVGFGDSGRIAAQIVTGIGFLGAGTIMRLGPEIRGLTTAASIWTTAAIGMAIGLGGAFLIVAVAATILTLVTLGLVERIESKIKSKSHPTTLLVGMIGENAIVPTIQAIETVGATVCGVKLEKIENGLRTAMEIMGDRSKVIGAAITVDGVLSATWGE